MTWTNARIQAAELWTFPQETETIWDGGATLWDLGGDVARTYWDATKILELWAPKGAVQVTWGEQSPTGSWTPKSATIASWTEQ
jgi:hypothetical protein